MEAISANGSKVIVIEAGSHSRRAHAKDDGRDVNDENQKKINPVDLSKTFEDINIDNSNSQEPEIIAKEEEHHNVELVELESSDEEESETFNFMESKLE